MLVILTLPFITVIYDFVSFKGKDCVLLAYLFSTVFNNLQRVVTQLAFIEFEKLRLLLKVKHSILYYL